MGKREAVLEEPTSEQLLKAQENTVQQEKASIESFIARCGWKMVETPSGLFYDIYYKTKGVKVESGNAVQLKYTLALLNGVEIANSDMKGLKTIIIGKTVVESGLLEALLKMRKGEKAHVVIPSHLGFGFSGDGDRIPAQATLIYDLTVEQVLIPPSS